MVERSAVDTIWRCKFAKNENKSAETERFQVQIPGVGSFLNLNNIYK